LRAFVYWWQVWLSLLVGFLVWNVLGFLMFLGGFYSGNAVTATLGVAIVFAGVSNFLTLHVANENKLKKALEVFSAIGAVE
jgi:hypothetical protein